MTWHPRTPTSPRCGPSSPALAAAPEVRAVGGPWTHLYGQLDVEGGTEDLTAEIREPGRSPVDQPLVTAGAWLAAGDDGVVLEDGLADALGVGPGDTISVQGQSLPVRGAATTVSRGRFPLSRPAQIWVTPATGEVLRRAGLTEEGLEMQLRLDNADDAAAFADAHRDVEASTPTSTLFLETWQQRRADSHSDIDILAGTLFLAGFVVGLLTIATAAVIVAGRMAAQTRQIGTLKAVGVTPRQVVLALLVENLTLAGLATAAGLAAGRVIAPRLASTSLTVLGEPETPALTGGRVAIVAGVAGAVVALATIRPALRGLRHSTLRSLASGARPPRSRRAPGTARPVGGWVVEDAARRCAGPAVGGAAARTPAHQRRRADAGGGDDRGRRGAAGQHRPVGRSGIDDGAAGRGAQLRRRRRPLRPGAGDRPRHGRAAARAGHGQRADRRRLRGRATAPATTPPCAAVGATPRQTVAVLVVSQLGACLLAVALGLPLGLGLWGLMDGGDLPPVDVGTTTLLAIAAAVPVAFAVLVSLPALRQARRAPAPALAYE